MDTGQKSHRNNDSLGLERDYPSLIIRAVSSRLSKIISCGKAEGNTDLKEGIFQMGKLAFEYRPAHERLGIPAPQGKGKGHAGFLPALPAARTGEPFVYLQGRRFFPHGL